MGSISLIPLLEILEGTDCTGICLCDLWRSAPFLDLGKALDSGSENTGNWRPHQRPVDLQGSWPFPHGSVAHCGSSKFALGVENR